MSGKTMILQGVGHPISCLGVCYVNDPPKKGGVYKDEKYTRREDTMNLVL